VRNLTEVIFGLTAIGITAAAAARMVSIVMKRARWYPSLVWASYVLAWGLLAAYCAYWQLHAFHGWGALLNGGQCAPAPGAF
jgi:hypothetical protein